MPETNDNQKRETPKPNTPKPLTKREKNGSFTDNPFAVFIPSDFKDVDPGPGLERRENGKVAFGEGNRFAKIGHLNKRQKQAAMRQALDEAITYEDIVAILKRAVEDAKKGDPAARSEVLNRKMGKCPDKIEVETTDSEDSNWQWVIERIASPRPIDAVITIETTTPLQPLPDPNAPTTTD